VVADDQIEPAVGPLHDRVRAVLAHRARERAETLRHARRFGDAIERGPLRPVAGDEEDVAVPQETLAPGHLVGEGLDRRVEAVLAGIGESRDAAPLRRDQDAIVVVEPEVDHRADGIGDALDLETGQRLEVVVGLRRVEPPPRRAAVGADLARGQLW
jgi:hypothetical protein